MQVLISLFPNLSKLQKESGSEHVESGILIFNCNHQDKQKYINCFENFYMIPTEFNNFGQLFDGFVVAVPGVVASVAVIDFTGLKSR